MGKSFNISNPVMDYISNQAEQEQPANTSTRERKTRRLVCLLKQSTYDKLKARADAEEVSINHIVNKILDNNL